ncbi:MAG: site-2 protease family protein [bacterium]|nr:site-2 protease family protein [bacterium]
MEYNYPPYRTEIPDYPAGQSREDLPPPKKTLNIILFILTVFSTLFMGSILEGGNPFESLSQLRLGIPFSGTLLGIIGLHEFGHYYMCKRHGVSATLPFFIPAPTIIGTLGAVIKIKSPITNNKALFDIGAAGPIAGFVVAIPAVIYGLQISTVMEVQNAAGGLTLGDPLLMKIAMNYIIGEIPEGFSVYISSVGFAGWVGLLVTAFNLLPIGQLDGGHIAYSLMGKKQTFLGYATFIALFPLTFYWWGWFVWIIIALVMKIKHPTAHTVFEPLDLKRKMIGLLCLIIFILCFIPIPIVGMGLKQFAENFTNF